METTPSQNNSQLMDKKQIEPPRRRSIERHRPNCCGCGSRSEKAAMEVIFWRGNKGALGSTLVAGL